MHRIFASALLFSLAVSASAQTVTNPPAECLGTEFPNTPIGVSATADGTESGLGAPWKFRMQAWRLECAGPPLIMISVVPYDVQAGSMVQIQSRFEFSEPGGDALAGTIVVRPDGVQADVVSEFPQTFALVYTGNPNTISVDTYGSVRVVYTPVQGDPVQLDVPPSTTTGLEAKRGSYSVRNVAGQDLPGQGVMIDVDETQQIIAGTIADADASGNPRWHVFAAPYIQGTAAGEVYAVRTPSMLGVFQDTDVDSVGDIELVFTACDTATLRLALDNEAPREVIIVRVTPGDGC